MGKKFGVSFSWKRALGVSSAKQKFARMTGIPTTRQGRQRKAGRILSGGGCLLSVILFTLLLLVSCTPDTRVQTEQDQELIRTQIAQTVMAEFEQTRLAVPTITPTATEQPVSDEVKNYISDTILKMDSCSGSMMSISERMTELGQNTSFLFDSVYMSTTYSIVDEFEANCTYFFRDNLPAELTYINDQFKKVDENYALAAINLRSGLSTVDADKINRANEYLSLGTGYLLNASDDIMELYQ